MTEHEKLFDRIRKMHAKAESAKELGNDAEALAFASAVQKLLLRHNLEISDVQAQAEEQADPVKAHFFHPEEFGLPASKSRVAWTENLARVIATAHMCQVLPIRGSNRILLIGTRQNRQLCELMIVTMTRYASQHSESDYVRFFYECRNEGDVTRARGYKAGWLLGFVRKLSERYQDERAELRGEFAYAGNKHALLRLDKQLIRLQDTANEIIKNLAAKNRPVPKGRSASAAGVADGIRHGEQVNLTGTGLTKAADRKAVGKGQLQLGSGA